MRKGALDIAIIGGGGSGLSLLYALHLQGQLKNHKVLLVEPDVKNSNDRTWCFWTDQSDAAWQMFSPVVSKSWSKIEGTFPGQQNLKPYQYVQIRSKDYYHFIEQALEQYSNIERKQSKLESISGKDPFHLSFADGTSTNCDWIFDSRPPRLETKGLIWQSFVGYRIQFKDLDPDLDCCRLMDFEVPQQEGLQFMYWLPTSKTEALIEFTRFGINSLSKEESQEIIKDYLELMGVEKFKILEKEIERIPMTLGLNARNRLYPENEKHIAIGARAGTIKASTGFAFKYFVEHNWALAKAFKEQRALPKYYHPLRFRLYDELLMRIITGKESRIKIIFERLFKKHPVQRIFRFLDEKSRFDEEFRIMFSMPWMPFFWSIKESILERIRSRF